MSASRRITILSVTLFILLALLGVWWFFGFSLDFMQFFAVEILPTPIPSTASSTTMAVSPSQVVCSPVTQTVAVGQSANLTAQGGIGDYTWFAPEGILSIAESSAAIVSYSSKGIKKVTVQRARMINGAVSQFIDSVACTVIVQ